MTIISHCFEKIAQSCKWPIKLTKVGRLLVRGYTPNFLYLQKVDNLQVKVISSNKCVQSKLKYSCASKISRKMICAKISAVLVGERQIWTNILITPQIKAPTMNPFIQALRRLSYVELWLLSARFLCHCGAPSTLYPNTAFAVTETLPWSQNRTRRYRS